MTTLQLAALLIVLATLGGFFTKHPLRVAFFTATAAIWVGSLSLLLGS
jgi:hypothetical protein